MKIVKCRYGWFWDSKSSQCGCYQSSEEQAAAAALLSSSIVSEQQEIDPSYIIKTSTAENSTCLITEACDSNSIWNTVTC